MQTMNLFGLPDDLMGDETNSRSKPNPIQKHNESIKKIVREMVTEAMDKDPKGTFRNFGQRKAWSSYDPYSTEGHFEHLRYEDEIHLRASIVIDEQ